VDAEQGLYLVQARSDHRAYLLLTRAGADGCHRVHYLQMATEKLAKAYFWRAGRPLKKQHDYFLKFLRAVGGRGDVGRAVDVKPSEHWEAYVERAIKAMAPAVAGDGPNAEYPWPHAKPECAPATYEFPLCDELETHRGKKFLDVLRRLLDHFEKYA
jgi:hypothetical protein